MRLQCIDTGGPPTEDTWRLSGNGWAQYPDEEDCNPFRQVYLDVPIQITGGPCAANLYDVVIET